MLKKKLLSLMLLCLCFICTTANAHQTDLYVDDATASSGSEIILSVNINNTEGGVAGFSCKIFLPDGFEVTKASRGTRLMEKNANDEYVTTFQSAQQADGSFMLLAYGGQAISGTDGEVAKVTVSVPDGAENGTYSVDLREIECSMGSSITSTYTETSAVLTIADKSYAQGYTICTTPVATTAGAANTIVLNFSGVGEDIAEIEFDIDMPSCLSRTKNGRVTMAFEGADENRMWVSGTEGDHTIAVSGNHVAINAIVDDEYKYIAGTSGALVNMYYTTAAGTADGIYPIQLSNITMKNGEGDILQLAPTTSYIKVGNPIGESLTLIGHVADEVNVALATENALASVDMDKVVSMDGRLTIVDGRSFIAPKNGVNVREVAYSRSLANEYGTICLPFTLQSNSSVQYYKLAFVSETEMTFEAVSAVGAGEPVLFRNLNGNELSIMLTDVTVEAGIKEKAQDAAGWTIVGTYEEANVGDTDYIIANNKFWNAGQLGDVSGVVGVKVAPFRAYLHSVSADTKVRSLNISVDNNANDMEAISAIADSKARFYDVNGRQNAGLHEGINIVRYNDGKVKKVIIK